MALTPLQRSVLYTLAYTAQFSYPLTADEVCFRLIGRLDQRTRVLSHAPTPTQVNRALASLVQKRLLKKEGISFSLRQMSGLVEIRRQRFLQDQAKWREVRSAVGWFKHIPWIQAIFVTGSLAMNNAGPDEDIDFMIVTAPDRLWLTRLVVSGLAWLRGKRRSWQGEEKRSWCFNLWLEADQLDLFEKYASLYTAYELIQARLVFQRHQTGEKLLTANRWIEQYLPSATRLRGRRLFAKSKNGFWLPLERSDFISDILDSLNRAAFTFQYWYMKSHMTRETVTRKYALFHPRDTQGWLYSRWRRVLEELV